MGVSTTAKLKCFKNRIFDVFTCHKNVPSQKLSISNLKIEEVDYINLLDFIIVRNKKCHTHVRKVENNIRKANGILHKFKYISLI